MKKNSPWKDSVRTIVLGLPKQFTTQDIYAHEKALARAHPENHNVRPKIRQQLQVLRDAGELRQGNVRGQWIRLSPSAQTAS